MPPRPRLALTVLAVAVSRARGDGATRYLELRLTNLKDVLSVRRWPWRPPRSSLRRTPSTFTPWTPSAAPTASATILVESSPWNASWCAVRCWLTSLGLAAGSLQHQSFREETRAEDGAVHGAYGYVEAGVLRITEYSADQSGYRYRRLRSLMQPAALLAPTNLPLSTRHVPGAARRFGTSCTPTEASSCPRNSRPRARRATWCSPTASATPGRQLVVAGTSGVTTSRGGRRGLRGPRSPPECWARRWLVTTRTSRASRPWGALVP